MLKEGKGFSLVVLFLTCCQAAAMRKLVRVWSERCVRMPLVAPLIADPRHLSCSRTTFSAVGGYCHRHFSLTADPSLDNSLAPALHAVARKLERNIIADNLNQKLYSREDVESLRKDNLMKGASLLVARSFPDDAPCVR